MKINMSRPKTLEERVRDGALDAELNVLYYQRVIRLYRNCSVVSILAGAAIWAGALLSTLAIWTMVALGFIAMMLCILSLGLVKRAKVHEALLPEYVRHAQALADIYNEGPDAIQRGGRDALSALAATEIKEAETVGAPHRRLLDRIQARMIEAHIMETDANFCPVEKKVF
jgi:hypothetical protein